MNPHDNQITSVRIRFLSDLRKDYYIQVSETPYLEKEKSVLSIYENVSKEREIFLRASLQLLDLKENGRSRERPPAPRINPKPVKGNEEENTMHDVIRLGYLKKCNHTSSLTISSMPGWKTKYVELRHGFFVYSDSGSDRSLKDLAQSDSAVAVNKRCIELNSDSCDCFQLIDDPSGSNSNLPRKDCIFVITVKGGSRRLWMASNPDECREWVRNIKSAIVGHGVSRHLFSQPPRRGNENEEEDPDFISVDERSSFTATSSLTTWLSIEGAAAPYARNMSLYLDLKHSFGIADTEEAYKEVLSHIQKENLNITIPVLFVKSKSTGNHFVLSAQDSLTSNNFIGKDCSSQIWKDLQRDRIVIDGDEVTGALGAEAMVGALVRHISDKAEIIKTMEESSKSQHGKLGGAEIPNLPYHHQHNPLASKFTVTDAQIVESARDLLVLCNRTQSGGDTYFCVDALFRGENSKDLCLLAPFSPEADPLNFKVDIVEIHKEHVPSLHRKSYHPKDRSEMIVFPESESKLEDHSSSLLAASTPTTTTTEGRVTVSDTPTVALYETRPLHTHEERDTRRRPQLNLTDILEEDGYFAERRVSPETLRSTATTEPRYFPNRTIPTYSDAESNCEDSQNDSQKMEVPPLVLVSASKDDQSIVSELTFDTYVKHGLREGTLQIDNSNITVLRPNNSNDDGVGVNSGDEEQVKGPSVSASKNQSLLKKLGKRWKMPKLSDLDGVNSPFNKRRNSLKSESSGDERYGNHRVHKARGVHFGQLPTSSHKPVTENEDLEAKHAQKTLCIRVQVKAKSKFKLCTLNPVGVEEQDTWATISGVFYQSFYIVGDGSGHLGIADRLVTIHVDSIS